MNIDKRERLIMSKFERDVKKVKALNEGESYFVHMGEEQGGEIMKGPDYAYVLYEVTWDGYIFEGWYKNAEEAVKLVHSWT